MAIGLSGCVLSCSTPTKKTALDVTKFELRPVVEETLPNGLKVLYIKDPSLPRLSMQLLVRASSLDDPQELPGLNALVALMLDQGTKVRKAPALADALAQSGIEFAAQPGRDFTTLSASSLSQNERELHKLFFEILTQPSFEGAELERIRTRVLADHARRQDQPDVFADDILGREIFGNHPYGYPLFGTSEAITKMRRADVVRHFERFFRPGNAQLAITGAITDQSQNEIRRLFSQWKGGLSAQPETGRPPKDPVPARKFVSKADLKQTQIRFGHLGIQRNDPDFLALRMANLILGGGFTSRLNQRVRDDLGLTYSIHSQSDVGLERGSFEISTFTRNEKAQETIREVLALVDDFYNKGITEAELAAGQALLIGQFPASVETVDRLAGTILTLRRYGIPDDYLVNYNQNVAGLSVKAVNAAIRKHLQPAHLKIVVYADRKAVFESLKSLGPWELQDLSAKRSTASEAQSARQEFGIRLQPSRGKKRR